jgi:hypothetical protein
MIMKNNVNLKNLVLNNLLTTSEMMLIKGGDSGSGQNSQGQNSQGNLSSDDKRRERPGGGISTCV